MGAPMAFEMRRSELNTLGYPDDDYSVTQSFIDMLIPPTLPVEGAAGLDCPLSEYELNSHYAVGRSHNYFGNYPIRGLLAKYLMLSQLIYVNNDILFVHGAVHQKNLG